ncbi:MAG: hypothetical protein M1548_04335 [Actinobacteria bacterium]|nr:hypothetical protein [Actinomycetota bacterium]
MVVTSKDKLRVMIYIGEYWLEADIHMLPGSRLTDALNVKTKEFLALTNVKVIDPHTGRVTYEIDYAAVNRIEIEIIFPIEAGLKPTSEEVVKKIVEEVVD